MNKKPSILTAFLPGIIFMALLFPAWAQEAKTIRSDELSRFSFSPFAGDVPRAQTSARIAKWLPAEGSGLIAVRFVFPESYHQIDNAEFFTLIPQAQEGIIFGSVLKEKPLIKDGLKEYFDETTLLLEFRSSGNIGIESLGVNALFQICDEDGVCLLPDAEFHEIPFNATDEAIEADSQVRAILEWNAEKVQRSVSMPINDSLIGEAVAIDNYTPWYFFVLALIGGILLNIMPCVFPLLTLKALALVKQAELERRTIVKNALVYALGIEFSFWILAGIVVILQASGRLIGWGFQFQSPVFLLILISIIWVFALSLFDVFIIQAPRKGLQGALASSARGGYLGNFLTGMFAVIIATPCTAPFLGPALGFAFSQSPLLIFLMFSIIGIGLSLPYVILGIWPGLIKRIPRPGPWMNIFKTVMGFLMLGTAVYLLGTFNLLAPMATGGILWWLLALALSVWILGKVSQPSIKKSLRWTGKTAVLLLVLGAGFAFIDMNQINTGGAVVQIDPSKNSAIAFDEAEVLRWIDEGQPLFIEFTAAWCTTCKINQPVINNDEVQAMMRKKNIIHVVGDLTAYDETLVRWLRQFNRAGVPLYVLYRSDGQMHVFPEFLRINDLLRQMEMIN